MIEIGYTSLNLETSEQEDTIHLRIETCWSDAMVEFETLRESKRGDSTIVHFFVQHLSTDNEWIRDTHGDPL